MSRKIKVLPDFASEAEERAFWEAHDSSDYADWGKAERVQPLGPIKPAADRSEAVT